VDQNYSIVQPVELGGASTPTLLLKNVYTLYGSQFRRWFAITAPTSLLASAVLLIADQRIRSIYESIPRGEIQFHWDKIAQAFILRFGGFFVDWLLGCFILAAIATAVNGLDVNGGNEVWRRDSYQRAREHFGALFLTALLTFCAFLAGMVAVGVVVAAVIRVVGWSHFSRFNMSASLIGYVVVASIVSWFGMAIPLILSGDIRVWAALKRSMRLSNGYEVFLLLLVVESVVGSYAAWYAIHYGLMFLFPAQLQYTAWFGWIVYGVAILASAAVQPPMFIGFSLLAANRHPNSLCGPSAQQTPHVD
jgi:hypothetical protein